MAQESHTDEEGETSENSEEVSLCSSEDGTDNRRALAERACTLDMRLIALRELFNRDHMTVERQDGLMGDYSVTITDHCYHERNKDAAARLGFSQNTIHCHIIEASDRRNTSDEPKPEMTVYFDDTRSSE